MSKKKIALLFFSRSAALESCEKAWFSAEAGKRNRFLANSLVNHTHRILRRSGYPVFHFHENNQRGDTFGQRLADAYQQVFALGFEAVVAVGNDTPQIGRIDWAQVSKSLAAGKCVIGPNFRRGAYLIGLTSESFNKASFQRLPWQSPRLLETLLQYCSLPDHPPVLLATFRDINTSSDIWMLARNSSLGIFLRKLVGTVISGFFPVPPRSHRPMRSGLFRLGRAHFRAPPVIFS